MKGLLLAAIVLFSGCGKSAEDQVKDWGAQLGDAGKRDQAAKALAGLGAPGAALLAQELKSPDAAWRLTVVKALDRMGGEAIEPLTEALADKEMGVVTEAARGLRKHGQAARTAIPALVKVIKLTMNDRPKPDPGLENQANGVVALVDTFDFALALAYAREAAAQTLVAIGPDAFGQVAALVHDPDKMVGVYVFEALGNDSERVIPLAREAMKDEQPHVRSCAIDTLKKFAPATIPDLIAALGDRDDQVASDAERSLLSIGLPAANALGSQLKARDPAARVRAARILWKFSDCRDTTIPDLKAALEDPDESVRREVESALFLSGYRDDPKSR